MKTYPVFPIPNLVERPGWWAVRNDEITRIATSAKKGQVAHLANSAGGLPIHSVTYGPTAAAPGTGSWISASNSRRVEAYKTNEEGPQVVVLLCGVHGAEPEGVAGAVNLIHLLETGADLTRKRRPGLVELCSAYRLIIIPCLNPDGRAVSPDHLRGATNDEFRRASQGIWLDGTEVGYPACKEYVPLPLDRVQHPGGYPNAHGYNIQHDASPGDIRTEEARKLLEMVAREQVDLVLNMHSHPLAPRSLSPCVSEYPLHATRILDYADRFFEDLNRAGLRPEPVLPRDNVMGYCLNNACSMASGALGLTFEHPTVEAWSFEEILEIFFVAVETCLKWGRTEKFAPRRPLARGFRNG